MTDKTNIGRRTLITAASGAALSLALMSKRAAAHTAERNEKMDQAQFERERGMSSELWRLSASEVARLVRTRKVSAREVADAALQRLDSVNARINAIVDCRPDLVRQRADRVDRVVARGIDPGALAGVPVTVKINVDQAGFATTEWKQAAKGPDRQIQQPRRRQSAAQRCGAARAQQRTNVCPALVYQQLAPWQHTQPT